MTLTHHGGVDIEELDKSLVAQHPLRSPDRPQGLRRRQRPDRAERAQADHLAAGSATAQALGAVPQFRHDHARAEPDPHAPGSPGPPDAGRLRLQVRLRPRRPALEPPEPADRPVRRGLLRLRAGDQPAPDVSGPERRLRHQLGRHDPGSDVRRRRQLDGDRDAGRQRHHLLRLRRQSALREDARGGPHLLQALAQADQRAVHHRRQVATTPTSSKPSAPWPMRCANTSARTVRRRSTS